MSSFSPGRKDELSCESLWSTSSWVMCILDYFRAGVKFPCRDSRKLSLYIRGRIAVVEAMPPPRRPGKVRVIPLVSEANAMPSSSSQVPVPVMRILCMLTEQQRELEGKSPVRKPIMT